MSIVSRSQTLDRSVVTESWFWPFCANQVQSLIVPFLVRTVPSCHSKHCTSKRAILLSSHWTRAYTRTRDISTSKNIYTKIHFHENQATVSLFVFVVYQANDSRWVCRMYRATEFHGSTTKCTQQ